MDAQQAEVELDPGDEHQVEQAELAEVGDRRVAGVDPAEPVAGRSGSRRAAGRSGPGRRARWTSGGPRITTRKRTRNSQALPVRGLDRRSRGAASRIIARPQQRHAGGAGGRSQLAQPAFGELVERAVGEHRPHRRADRLGVARSPRAGRPRSVSSVSSFAGHVQLAAGATASAAAAGRSSIATSASPGRAGRRPRVACRGRRRPGPSARIGSARATVCEGGARLNRPASVPGRSRRRAPRSRRGPAAPAAS